MCQVADSSEVFFEGSLGNMTLQDCWNECVTISACHYVSWLLFQNGSSWCRASGSCLTKFIAFPAIAKNEGQVYLGIS